MNSKDEKYFSHPGISNSALGVLNPSQGGSIQKLKRFYSQDSEKRNRLSLERGSLLHLYCEDPENFIVSDIDKPSEKIASIIEAVHRTINSRFIQPDALELASILIAKARELGFGNGWKDQTILDRLNPSLDYLRHLQKADNKIIMTQETKIILDNCIKSLYNNPRAHEYIFTKKEDLLYLEELEIYWDEDVYLPGRKLAIPCKAKIDKLIINLSTREVELVDLKTTSKSVYRFPETFEDYHYYRQHAFYKKAVKIFLERNYPDIKFNITNYNVVVETTGEHISVVYKVPPEWIEKGRLEYVDLLTRYGWHSSSGLMEQSMEEYLKNGILTIPIK